MKKLVLFFLCLTSFQVVAQQQKVWLDADTGNEMDDVYAIIRLLWAAGQYDIKGLSAAHFNNADLMAFNKWNQYTTPGIQPVRISQALNEEILTTMGLSHIPHPMGADRQMGRAWGGFEPRSSAATDAMQQEIKALKSTASAFISTMVLHPALWWQGRRQRLSTHYLPQRAKPTAWPMDGLLGFGYQPAGSHRSSFLAY